MKIIIAGAGEVGFHLSEMLVKELQDIILIDQRQEKLNYAESKLDLITIAGDATSISTLKEANISKTDMLIAVTDSQETNIAISILGKQMGARSTIARINNAEYLKNKDSISFESLGIDHLILPEMLAAKEILRLIKEPAFSSTFEFGGGSLSLIGITLDEEDEQLVGKNIMDTAIDNPDANFIIVAIQREGDVIIPRGSNKFLPGDKIFFISEPQGVPRILNLAGKERMEIRNVMILGGSKTGINAARMLQDKYEVKIIEKDKEKCNSLVQQLPNTLVINGDGTNASLLLEENIQQMDAFIAVTGGSETNMISSLVAQNHHVKRVISLVENQDYIELAQNIGLDTIINKKLIAADYIFRFIRKGRVIARTGLHGIEAEILEYVVSDDSRIIKDRIRNIKFPRDAIIGGVIREGRGYVTMGDFQLIPKDHVVVFALPSAISEVEKLFG